ncbi:hypothetical protein [Promicromonospora sp. NPDC023805]|uniref:hypothetical protein n=1 Tax=Promicromonospora sp. NPDC023805 TaxID=3154696 RepID=UPI0033E7CC32
MSPDEWSVVWEGVAAVGTMLAVVWAVFTTLTERRKRSAVEKELTKEQATSRVAKRREQPEHVAVWFEEEYRSLFGGGPPSGGKPDLASPHGTAFVGNYSGAPIFNVSVSAEAVLSEESFQLGFTNVVPPGPEPWSVDLAGAAGHGGELLMHVEFQDVAGVRWRRSSGGGLEEMPSRLPQK